MASSCSKQEDVPVLRFASFGGAGADDEFTRLVKALDKQFEEKHGVKVVSELIPGEYVQKMLLNHVANTMPDVMVLDASSAAVFLNNDILEDLSPRIAAEEKGFENRYFANVLDVFRREGKIFGLPNDFTPMVLYYNKDLFDAAGVPYPQDGWTFEEFREKARLLTKPEKKQYGFVFANWMPGWVMWLWNNGGSVLSPDGTKASGFLDSPKNAETVAFLRDLIVKDKVAPSLSQAAALGVDPFLAGQAAMTVSGHWSMVDYRKATAINWKRLGVVTLPTNLPRSQTVLYMTGFAIPKGAKNKDLAWEYVKMRASAEFQRPYNASGIAISGVREVAEEKKNDPLEAQFMPIIPTGRPPSGSLVEGYQVVETVGQSMMDSVLNNGRDPLEALRSAAQRIDRELAK